MGSFQHDGAVSKLLDKAILALDGFGGLAHISPRFLGIDAAFLTSIRDLGDLVALVAVPPLVRSSIDKLHDLSTQMVPARD